MAPFNVWPDRDIICRLQQWAKSCEEENDAILVYNTVGNIYHVCVWTTDG